MGALEALAGELACAHITDREIAEIRKLQDRMEECYEKRELAPYFELNQEIHSRILHAARNKTLIALAKSLGDRLRRARYVAKSRRLAGLRRSRSTPIFLTRSRSETVRSSASS